MNEQRRLRPGEATFGYMLLIFSLFLLYNAFAISGFSSLSSPGVFPLVAASAMVVSALTIILKNRAAPQGEATTFSHRLRLFHSQILPLKPMVIYIAMVIGFMMVLEPFGFIPSALIFLFVSFWYLYAKGAVFALVLSIGSVAIVYALFRLVFKVVLPEMEWLDLEALGWEG